MPRTSFSYVVFIMFLGVCSDRATCSAETIYDDGPINTANGGWTISSGTSVSDSFVSSESATLTTATIGLFIAQGATPESVQWAIGTSAFQSTISTGTSTLTNVYQETYDYYGTEYDIYESTFSLSGVISANQTYYLTLSNGLSPTNAALIWNENYGPSKAYQSSDGSVGSESFSLVGLSAVPEPGSLILGSSGLALAALGLSASRRRPDRKTGQ